jgi:hypothetical protein
MFAWIVTAAPERNQTPDCLQLDCIILGLKQGDVAPHRASTAIAAKRGETLSH